MQAAGRGRLRGGDAAWCAYRFESGAGNQKPCWRLLSTVTVPVVVDAGIGVPSHATQALEMGADAVLVNTAIAVADDSDDGNRFPRLKREYWRQAVPVIVAPTPAPPARSPDFWEAFGMKTFSDRWRQLGGTIFACASTVKLPPTWSAH